MWFYVAYSYYNNKKVLLRSDWMDQNLNQGEIRPNTTIFSYYNKSLMEEKDPKAKNHKYLEADKPGIYQFQVTEIFGK